MRKQPGSSPQVRGTHLEKVAGAQKDRFIPAGAGNADLSLNKS